MFREEGKNYFNSVKSVDYSDVIMLHSNLGAYSESEAKLNSSHNWLSANKAFLLYMQI